MQHATPDRDLVVEDLYDLPDDGTRHELECGRLVSEPLPGMRHGRIAARLARQLGEFVERTRLGVVFAGDAGFVLARRPDTVRGPDLAFVTQKRFASVGDSVRAFPGAPDLAVEIVSPSQRPSDLHAKVADYLAGGARRVWIVDPQARTVTVHDTLLAPRTLKPGDVLDGEDVLPGFTLAVDEIFAL